VFLNVLFLRIFEMSFYLFGTITQITCCSYHLLLFSFQSSPILSSFFLVEPLCSFSWAFIWLRLIRSMVARGKNNRILFLLYPLSSFPVFQSVYECLFLWICIMYACVFNVSVRMLNRVTFVKFKAG
jgi:hypothetical protein